MRSWVERTHSKTVVGGPSEVVDCGAGRSRLQLAGKKQLADPGRQWPAIPHSCTDKPGGTKGEQNRLHNPRAPPQRNKASIH